ncbi:MAG: hypothetical protein DA443_09550 [Bacteroidetes bacterium]|jgi:hypothetical protein|nr:MAG: hypothetical protein DA443_09550 [Bacteroidota bacterium]
MNQTSYGYRDNGSAPAMAGTELPTARNRPPTSLEGPILGRPRSMDNSLQKDMNTPGKRTPSLRSESWRGIENLDSRTMPY